jgi:hypothetical protein
MADKKIVGASGLPKIQKKSMLQQVMKPKDWMFLFVLIVISATCWLWVLSAYQDPISISDIISVNLDVDKSA